MNIQWLRKTLQERGITQEEAALGAGMTQNMLTKVLNGHRKLTADEADGIRRFLGFEFPEDRRPISVVGMIGAGDGVELVDAYEHGAGMFHIARPDWIPAHGVVAAQIKGSSAEPWALDGDIVFWRRSDLSVQQADLGRPVIAELEDGRVMLKRLASSSVPGCWSLLSINPSHPNVMDVRLVWASRAMAPLAYDEAVIVEG